VIKDDNSWPTSGPPTVNWFDYDLVAGRRSARKNVKILAASEDSSNLLRAVWSVRLMEPEVSNPKCESYFILPRRLTLHVITEEAGCQNADRAAEHEKRYPNPANEIDRPRLNHDFLSACGSYHSVTPCVRREAGIRSRNQQEVLFACNAN
jgi:hypothetical protein